MNTFLTVLCLALVATASAKPAYNYQQNAKIQTSGGGGGGVFKQQSFRPSTPVSSSGIYAVVQSPPLSSFNVQPQPAPAPAPVSAPTTIVLPAPAPAPIGLPAPAQFAQQYVAPAPQYIPPVQQQQQFSSSVQQQQQQFAAAAQQQFVAPIQQQQFIGAASGVQAQYQPNYQPQHQQQTIISKDIYIHSAPEEVEEIGNDGADQPAGPIRKNYRIVFIKAPSQNVKLNLDALKRAQASNEEKTVIYVLSKKPDLSDIQNQLSVVQNDQKSHKPEVYFIKYKTQEEANRAQQEIQAQYDSLGGSTHISDEGIAPVTSVIGGGAINVGGLGSSLGGSSSYQGGSSFGQQQFAQQSYQSSQSSAGGSSSSVSFGGVSNQKYLPATKK